MSVTVETSEHGRIDGEAVALYTLAAANGLEARISELGATLVELHVPGRGGDTSDVVLGFDRFERYLEPGRYFGCVVGRVANRIAGASFTLDGREYDLSRNEGRHHLHGGARGFSLAVWRGEVSTLPDGAASLRLRYRSPDGEDGYPGALDATVVYTLVGPAAARSNPSGPGEVGELRIDFEATTDRATLVNLSQHSFWNLAGHDSGDVLDQHLFLAASRYTPADRELIPTGAIVPAKGSPFDLTRGKRIGAAIDELAASGGEPSSAPRGFDVNYVLDGTPGAVRRAATLRDPASGRSMEVWTTEPGIQLYTGNYLDRVGGKDGAVYGRHAGLCLEPQRFPDAIHHQGEPGWPTVVLRPGERYRHQTVHRFRSL